MKETLIIINLNIEALYKRLTDADSLKVYLWTSVCLFLAYASEFGQFSFSSDYYHVLLNSRPPTSYSYDGRFFAEIIRFYILDGVLPPTMLLIIGVSLLALTGNIIAITWGCNNLLVRVLVGLLLAVFPFFYESFSYVNMRHIVPLAIFLSVLGVVTGGFHKGYAAKIKGFIFLYASLMLYQVSVNCAVVVIFMWGAMLMYDGGNPREVIEKLILPKLSMVFICIIAYKLTLYFTDFVGVSDTERFGSFSKYPQNLNEVRYTFSANLNAMLEYFYKGSFLFPAKAKLIATFILLVFVFVAFKKAVATDKVLNYLFFILLILLAIVSTHGLIMPFYPPEKFLVSRILIAYSLFGACVFLLATKVCNNYLQKIIIIMGAILVAIYIIQANMWHQYLLMKNQSEMDIAQQITHRLKADPAYTSNLPLAIIGTMNTNEYRYKYLFKNPVSLIKSSITDGVYSMDWSKDRLLKFYMPFIKPNEQQFENAKDYSLSHNTWPHPESVIIKDGVMIVVLNKIK